MDILSVLGLILFGAFFGRLFENYLLPILDMWIGNKNNKYTKQQTELQQEIYKIQESSKYTVQEPCIGFDIGIESEEYEEDENYE